MNRLAAVLLAQLNHVQCAEHIVLHRLDAVLLHQRYMLVRRSIDADVWVILLEHPRQPFLVGNADNLHPDVNLAFVGKEQSLLQVIG